MATKTKAKGAAKPAAGAKSEAKPKTEAALKKAEVERKADAGAKSDKAVPKSAGKGLKMESVEDKSLGLRLIQAGEAEKKVAASQRVTVGSVVMELLEENPDAKFEDVLERVKKVKPESRFDKKHWAWYRSRFKKERTA